MTDVGRDRVTFAREVNNTLHPAYEQSVEGVLAESGSGVE